MNINKQHINSLTKQTICILGIGNPLRSDDGVGAYVCQKIEEINLPEVDVATTHQLDIGMLEDLTKFSAVVFVDASTKDSTVSFYELVKEKNPPQSFSHHVNAALLVGLADKLYTTNTRFYICGIGAVNFEIGNSLSGTALSNAEKAVSLLREWVQSVSFD